MVYMSSIRVFVRVAERILERHHAATVSGEPRVYNRAVRVYAHWLDPEFVDALNRKAGMLERSLKVHALLGDTLVLSDIQLIDSPLIYRLFAKDDFRQFLRDFPAFMQVVAQPTLGNDRYSIVARSLER